MMRTFLLAGTAALLLTACGDEQTALDVPEMTDPAWAAPDALPVVLSRTDGDSMEAIVKGRLARRGPCIVLEMAPRPMVIIWGDEVTIERVGKTGWAVRDKASGESYSEGDWVQGGGGTYPENARISDLAEQAVPSPCNEYQAIQLYGAESAPPPRADISKPIQPAPRPPSLVDEQPANAVDPDFPKILVTGFESPREALFAHLLSIYRKSDHFGARPICLRDADTATVRSLAGRFDNLHTGEECAWQDGGVILSATGEAALWVHAVVDCKQRACGAQGGATYGNLGAESYGYRMERTVRGWSIQQNGLMTIS